MIQTLWDRHYHAGVTGSYHGDMVHAFAAMLADAECDPQTARKMMHSIAAHMAQERRHEHEGRKYFCERWGKPEERLTC